MQLTLDTDWLLACDTCVTGDGHHYHPWMASLAIAGVAVAVLVWLVSRRAALPVSKLGRIAATMLAIGPAVAALIVASSSEGRVVPCGEKNFLHATQTGEPCIDHGTRYRNTAYLFSAASVSGGVAVGLAAGVIARRRRDVTDPSQYVDETV